MPLIKYALDKLQSKSSVITLDTNLPGLSFTGGAWAPGASAVPGIC